MERVLLNGILERLKPHLLSEDSVASLEKLGSINAAVAIIIAPKEGGGSLLLIRRAVREGDPWSGQTAFPGGHRMGSDRSLLETAIRETEEEAGIRLRREELVGALSPVKTHVRPLTVLPLIFSLSREAAVKRGMEVADCFWVPLAEFQHLEPSQAEVDFEKGKRKVDCYILRGHVVWGLTFRILNYMLNR